MIKGQQTASGFTVVEILLVLGVFTVLSAVVLSNYRSYDSNAYFANASEDIVLALRQAQVYGAGAKANTAACGGLTKFDCSYGVYFSNGANGISLFADVEQNRVYTVVGDGAPIEQKTWGNAITIDRLFCGGLECITSAVSVTFMRPSPDAFIADIPVLSSSQPSPYNEIKIVLKNTNSGKFSTTTITRSGQISIE